VILCWDCVVVVEDVRGDRGLCEGAEGERLQ